MAVSEETSAPERCIKRLARNVAKNAKFHLSLQKVSLSIAGIVIEKEENSNSIRKGFPILLFFLLFVRYKL